MASFEGTRSHFPTQLFARSPKLRIYESLFLLNQGVDHVIAILRDMEKCPFARKDSLQHAHDELEELRAGVNADFIEELGDRERSDEGRFWKQRRAFEQKRCDPDDVYIEVERREQERKKQGLPSRVGVIPHSAVVQQGERWGWQQRLKRNRRRVGGKNPRNTHNAR
jgi:hypothetical protein